MRKFKIFLTCFILYEFTAITILQIQSFCHVFFNNNFCELNNYKYFLFCIMIPVLMGLVYWWIPKATPDAAKEKSLKEILIDAIPKQYISRLIIAAIIIGIKKFVSNYPKTKKLLDDVIKTASKKKI